ncbi:aldo/keto reductase [Brucella anthropi]|uniref:Aldo/keto reductase n=1 Tax=Brucella anthropi TaxID=529 RepID=A0A6I0D7J1_BRUAN|nr:aldo/keto reductase [Brucella anthropi]KAB2764461.1 aldo/keto reductase [Brucella anthropi]KAB2778241.1 aldo/keto reductase [Brucella anthropi]
MNRTPSSFRGSKWALLQKSASERAAPLSPFVSCHASDLGGAERNVYSGGESERIVGRAVKDFAGREDVVVATKAFFPMSDKPNDRGLSRKHILASVDASLHRLGMDYIDLFVIHRFDPETSIEETAEALDTVVRAGKVRYLGASSMHAWQFMKLLAFQRHNLLARFVSMQSQYNLITREDEEEMIPLCREEVIGLTPWSPLGRGVLAGARKAGTLRADTDEQVRQWYEGRGGVGETVAAVESVAAARGEAPARIALASVLAGPGITSPIVGLSKPHHLADALGALSLDLSGDEIETLEASMKTHLRGQRW